MFSSVLKKQVLQPLNIKFCFHRGAKTKIKVSEDYGRVRVGSKGNLWVSTVGLEVHAQIASKSKLFSGSAVDSRAPVNTRVALLDASIPGTLPSLNKKCVELGIKTALALNCKVNQVSNFDRKHYFYADLPTGYQITQQRNPLASNGKLDFVVLKSDRSPVTYETSANIIQLQLEQDSGKSLHDEDNNRSLIDLNRCGTGLMEIVFGPDLFDGEEAAELIKELILTLEAVGSCNCRMEDGEVRVDANISVKRPGDPLGIRTEVKNINSVRAVANAIEHEISRQIEVLESGGIIENETRSYNASTKSTVPMRDKEAKQDYRFMPEPNLPPLRLVDGPQSSSNPNILNIDDYRQSLPELPKSTRKKLLNYGLSIERAVRLLNNQPLFDIFTQVMCYKPKSTQITSNILLNDVMSMCKKHLKTSPHELKISPKDIARAADLRFEDVATTKLAMWAIEAKFSEPHMKDWDLDQILQEKGWLHTFRDLKVIEKVVDEAIRENPKLVKHCLKGKKEQSFSDLCKAAINKNPVLDSALVKQHLSNTINNMK